MCPPEYRNVTTRVDVTYTATVGAVNVDDYSMTQQKIKYTAPADNK